MDQIDFVIKMKNHQKNSYLVDRRRRLHELVVALMQQQGDLELLDAETQLEKNTNSQRTNDPARWLNRNKRVLNKYQALVRSAVTIDALLDAEQTLEPRIDAEISSNL